MAMVHRDAQVVWLFLRDRTMREAVGDDSKALTARHLRQPGDHERRVFFALRAPKNYQVGLEAPPQWTPSAP